MLAIIWILFPLVTIFIFLLLYGKTNECCKNSRLPLLAKCGGSFVSFCVAFSAIYYKGANPLSSLLVWGILCCVIADALLEIKFKYGVIVFGIGHILFILRFLSLQAFSTANIILWIVILLPALLFFKEDLMGINGNKVVFLLYPMLLTFMLSLSLTLPFNKGIEFLPTAIGGLLFSFSDSLVAMNFFGKGKKNTSGIIMITYYLALYLLAINPAIC